MLPTGGEPLDALYDLNESIRLLYVVILYMYKWLRAPNANARCNIM
jgi:hypothetical protein